MTIRKGKMSIDYQDALPSSPVRRSLARARAAACKPGEILVNDLGGAPTELALDFGARNGIGNQRAGGDAIATGLRHGLCEVEAMVSDTVARWGRVDILVNNAEFCAIDFRQMN